MTLSLLVVAGTRPEHIKLATVVRALRKRHPDIATTYAWSGQHTSEGMLPVTPQIGAWPLPDLTIPTPELPDYLREHRPTAGLVQGDTRTALEAALAARNLDTPVAHLEAGLRSWDPDQVEERNRRAIDALADLLLCPSPLAAAFVGVDRKPSSRVVVVGQTGLDALRECCLCEPWRPFPAGAPWYLLTLHRAELVDDGDRLVRAVQDVGRSLKDSGQVGAWPVHPRVTARCPIAVRAWTALGHLACPPVPYPSMASTLLSEHYRPAGIVTDSGGLVEEAYALGIPVVVVRPSTERWEVLADGCGSLSPPLRHPTVLDWRTNSYPPHRSYESPDPTRSASEVAADEIAAWMRNL